MIIEGMLTIALLLAESVIQPEMTPVEPPLPSPVCYEDPEGALNCHPIDISGKEYGR